MSASMLLRGVGAETAGIPTAPLTNNQRAALEWFRDRGWVSYHGWCSEFNISTTRSLRKRALLEQSASHRTTTYRITDAGRAAIAEASGSAT